MADDEMSIASEEYNFDNNDEYLQNDDNNDNDSLYGAEMIENKDLINHYNNIKKKERKSLKSFKKNKFNKFKKHKKN